VPCLPALWSTARDWSACRTDLCMPGPAKHAKCAPLSTWSPARAWLSCGCPATPDTPDAVSAARRRRCGGGRAERVPGASYVPGYPMAALPCLTRLMQCAAARRRRRSGGRAQRVPGGVRDDAGQPRAAGDRGGGRRAAGHPQDARRQRRQGRDRAGARGPEAEAETPQRHPASGAPQCVEAQLFDTAYIACHNHQCMGGSGKRPRRRMS